MHPLDHPVSRYATDVLEGKVVVGPLVRMACERHLLDLETGADRGLHFDCKAADRIINFAGLLRHTTGSMAGAAFELQPWQKFRHGAVFGWKYTETGYRRFRSTYHQVAKKNGKTTDTASPLLFTQLFDGEGAPQGYCAATTRDQAGLLFNETKRMIKKSPALSQLLKSYNSQIKCERTGGFIKALSRDGNAADGINPHFAARDEVHRWTDRELADVVTNSMLARKQSIDWAITTAGADMASLCGDLRTYSERVLRGDVRDDGFFAYVAEPPLDADPSDPETWHMANPNLGVAFTELDFRRIHDEAQVIRGKMPNFRRLHLNLWTAGAQSWIARDIWDGGMATASFDMADLFGRKAWVGIDLSRTTDLTSVAVAVPVGEIIFLLSFSFIAEGPKGFIARAQSENREYVAWRDDGWLEIHPGGVIDEDAIVERMKWIRERFDLQEVAFDRWGMKYVAGKLEEMRFPMLEHGQGYASMSPATKRFERAVIQKRLRHNANPLLAWSVGNVVLDEDAAENVKPNKKKATGRIDPAVAAIMAVGRAEVAKKKRKPIGVTAV